MTRKEVLIARSNDVVEESLKEGVCLSEDECLIVREAVLLALLQGDREAMAAGLEMADTNFTAEALAEHAMYSNGSLVATHAKCFEKAALWCRDQANKLKEPA